MVKGWQIFIWDDDDQEWYHHDSHIDPKRLAEACHELGMLRQRVQIREVNIVAKE